MPLKNLVPKTSIAQRRTYGRIFPIAYKTWMMGWYLILFCWLPRELSRLQRNDYQMLFVYRITARYHSHEAIYTDESNVRSALKFKYYWIDWIEWCDRRGFIIHNIIRTNNITREDFSQVEDSIYHQIHWNNLSFNYLE